RAVSSVYSVGIPELSPGGKHTTKIAKDTKNSEIIIFQFLTSCSLSGHMCGSVLNLSSGPFAILDLPSSILGLYLGGNQNQGHEPYQGPRWLFRACKNFGLLPSI